MGEIGGLVGNIDAGIITSCQTSGLVTAKNSNSVGGLVGSTYQALIELSSSSATVSTHSDAGGLIGYFKQSVIGSGNFASGNIDGVTNIGGLIGTLISPLIPLVEVHASGNAQGTNNVGGLVGYSELLSIIQSHASSEVVGIGIAKQLGGLVGNAISGATEDSYAMGNVAGVESLGGLVGDSNGGGINRS